MKFIFTIALVLLAAVWVGHLSCTDDDDDDTTSDPIDTDDDDVADDDDNDDASDDDTSDDDDTNDDGDHLYTQCCIAEATPNPVDDPGLPPESPGPLSWIEIERDFVDSDRGRTIPAKVLIPSSDGISPSLENGPYPVVVIAHGFSSFGVTVVGYGEHLASWGYIAIVPDLPFTNIFAGDKMSHLESAKDMLFLLNTSCCEHEESGSDFYDLVDKRRIAAAGHSMGGKLSVMTSLLDGGIDAVAGIDPVDGADPSGFTPVSPDFPDLTPEAVPDLDAPTLYMGGESGDSLLGPPCRPDDQSYAEFWKFTPPPSVEITFIGGDHTDFIPQVPFDICDTGTADHTIVKELASKYLVSFFNHRLRGWDYEMHYAGEGIDLDVAAGYVTWQAK